MQRLIRLSLLVVLLCILSWGQSLAQKPQAYVSGRIAPGDVRLFQKDTVYVIDKNYMVGGTLIIEPGTTVYFYPNSRLIDSVGGRIIADGDAAAAYNRTVVDPTAPGSGYYGYADLKYFLKDNVSDVNTTRDLTIDPSKHNYVVNVILDTMNRKIEDFPMLNANKRSNAPVGDHKFVIPFEQALMFKNARLQKDPKTDIIINNKPWQRFGSKAVDVVAEKINFIGQPINNSSREWGHIIVLPGARAAFFRNCKFDGFRKDVTVDKDNMYNGSEFGANTPAVNAALKSMTNGAGGAITTLSSRTWLLSCEFINNFARNRGGALQLLQAPEGYTKNKIITETYASNKNPNITEVSSEVSNIIKNNPIPRIDNIDNDSDEPFESDFDRQAYDDGRLALYLGRMRNLTFTNNKVQLANVIVKQVGGVDVVVDDVDNVANFPFANGNHALGGAVYISGLKSQENRQIEVAFGLNNSFMKNGTLVRFPVSDAFQCAGNTANNYQNAGASMGARGGAIYVGDYTSLMVAGVFESNETNSKFHQDVNAGTNSGNYSMGGAIYTKNTTGRLQVRGGTTRGNNNTKFVGNKAGAGGALYVDGNTDKSMSPVIGGSDSKLITRNYGFDINFENNQAQAFGGAIFTKRNMRIQGAGGAVPADVIGYGGKFPVIFKENKAGYAGGAIDVRIPNTNVPFERSVSLVRTNFVNNIVGQTVTKDENKMQVRGGGAIYAMNADLTLVKACEFRKNMVYNGNGGAIAMISPNTVAKRFFVTDLDKVNYLNGVPNSFESTNDPFIKTIANKSPDTRMLTRFLDNEIIVEDKVLAAQNGSGATQVGKGTIVTSKKILGTYWIDNMTGYAVGQSGLIIKFTNGGNNWEYLEAGTNYTLTDVYFTDANIGYAIGARGVILKTVNAGKDWAQLNTNVDKDVNAIKFLGTNVAFAVCDGGYILKTMDAGTTWTKTRPVTSDLKSVDFNDGVNNGFVVGERGALLKTIDGGNSWILRTMAGLTANLNSVFFKSPSNGYAVGANGTMIVTTNSGDNWEFATLPTTNNLNAVLFTGQAAGYIVGDFGTFIKTQDGGTTWTKETIETKYATYSLTDVNFPSKDRGYVVGDAGMILNKKSAEWTAIRPSDEGFKDVVRYHQGTNLVENGVGLGGAIYILDEIGKKKIGRTDSIAFNRVRIQNNKAFTGSAVYSDNYDLKMIFNRSLITGNIVDQRNKFGWEQNTVNGPLNPKSNPKNLASTDLASATIYGEIQGPLPSYMYSEAANSIYGNTARFFVRLPDAPNSKGILAGTTGIGSGGTDTLRGNYWGRTEANVVMELDRGVNKPRFETFFIEGDGNTHLKFVWAQDPSTLANVLDQGPFESVGKYNYQPIPLANDAADITKPANNSIKETLLMSGRVYDIYDKGTDIKTADYSRRRMCPIEDFAVGIAPAVARYDDATQPSNGKYVKRLTRDPNFVDDPANAQLAKVQTEFATNAHPVGYPMYLETMVDYDGMVNLSNDDNRMLNETVFFVINENTTDYIRVNMKQVAEDGINKEVFRGRVELVPDLTTRDKDFLKRRNEEGLMNLGAGKTLLEKLLHNAKNEDGATLQGRKYHATKTASPLDYQLGDNGNIYSNRPDMPASNNGVQTYFAGERYRALPVNVGDTIRVISRTVLWREGVIKAFEDGVKIAVTGSTPEPDFTGDVKTLAERKFEVDVWPEGSTSSEKETVEIKEFKNVIFVSEDRNYPYAAGTFNNGEKIGHRDHILNITGTDVNKFFDPRHEIKADGFAQLTYDWKVDANSALSRWLRADNIYAATKKIDNKDIVNPKDDALGYLRFYGYPLNPFVVPGGEEVEVKISNYPPHYRTLDSLLKMTPPVDQAIIDQYIETYPEYFNAMKYDVDNARYLQQDTINFGKEYTNTYKFKIFVVDSVPQFKVPFLVAKTEAESFNGADTMRRRLDETGKEEDWVVYPKSVTPCELTKDGRLKANLTNKLRFKFDINTDDEMEDAAVIKHDMKAGITPWNFPYGKTSYGFMNVAIDGDGNKVIIDPFKVNKDEYELDSLLLIDQVRPIWLSHKYLVKFNDYKTADVDGVDFLTKGQVNVRIDKAEAMNILAPTKDYQRFGAINTDTTFTVICNDGHTGKNTMKVDVFINVQPEITTDKLADAKEDIDYNPALLDSSKAIKVKDLNFGQSHTFELVYDFKPQTPADTIFIDPCFEDAGYIVISDLAATATPKWLKINKESGLLYGTPRVQDTKKEENVIVIVEDEEGLKAWKVFKIKVDSVNHKPNFISLPTVKCVALNEAFNEEIEFSDIDLQREDPVETIKIKLFYSDLSHTIGAPIDPAALTTDPTEIKGKLASKKAKFNLKTSSFNLKRDATDPSRAVIAIVLDDGTVTETMFYTIRIADETLFTAELIIENNANAKQSMFFGLAQDNATTGTGENGETVGTLDNMHCEFELPPLGLNDVFDIRWKVPNTQGILRNIYPRSAASADKEVYYRGRFQAGGVSGSTSPQYPVTIKWKMDAVPATTDAARNPDGSSFRIKDNVSLGNHFNFNMSTGKGVSVSGISVREDAGYFILTITDSKINEFVIAYDRNSSVNESSEFTTEITKVSPNPVQNLTTITYTLQKASNVTLDIVDALGNVVAQPMVNKAHVAGSHPYEWDARNQAGSKLSSGTYVIRLTTSDNATATFPVVIVK